MDAIEHYLQDAFEILAVAELQRLAELSDLAITNDADEKFATFADYLNTRNATRSQLKKSNQKHYDVYADNLQRHLPAFFARLVEHLPGERFDFVDVEREARNRGGREDFLIEREGQDAIKMSLKNYRGSAARPQVCSGTFNSFIVNFLLEPGSGPGMVLHPNTGKRFRGSSKASRDSAIEALGLAEIIPLVHALDTLNDEIRATFVYGDDYEDYDKERVSAAQKHYGNAGADLALQIIELIGPERVKRRLLTLAGLDAGDEVLILDPVRCSDSLTNRRFHDLRAAALHPESTVRHERRGQSIRFVIVGPGCSDLLMVDVPFTLNTNGAWHRPSSGHYPGTEPKMDKGHLVHLRYGQRRPYKSKEFATSVNTYVELEAAGVFRD